MAAVWLDHLAAVAVADGCRDKARLLGDLLRKAPKIGTQVCRASEGTSRSRAGVERQIARSSPEDLLLGFGPLFLFIALFFSLWQAKLQLGGGQGGRNRQFTPAETYRQGGANVPFYQMSTSLEGFDGLVKMVFQ